MTPTSPPLRAGVIAAGFGSRMAEPDGSPKALARVAGRPLIDWVVDDIEDAGASEVVVIINKQSVRVREHLEARRRTCRVQWIVETTPSSMHSFLRVVEKLAEHGDEGPFLISTVDTIAPRGTYKMFVEAARTAPGADVVLGLTTRIEEEKPLTVQIGPFFQGPVAPITAFGGEPPYATAGYYFVRSSVVREAAAGRAANLCALRLFFGWLLDRGYHFTGVCMPDSIDVDRPSDVGAAEALLRSRTS